MRRHRLPSAPAGAAIALLLCGSGAATGQTSPRPGHEIDQQQVCLGCHDLEEDLGARVPHAPVAAGECTSCHNPHVARYKALLRQRPGLLCARCHDELTAELKSPTVHPPAAEGRCADCHRPHGSDNPGLLVRPGESLCLECHEDAAAWKGRAVQHAPFAGGDCATCHAPHASEGPGLLVRDAVALCLSCHPMDAALRRRHGGHPVERAACQQCHEPHASALAGLFREAVHAPFESGDCDTCHPGAGAPDPFAANAPLDELCGGCHEDEVEAGRNAPFPHVSAGGGECVRCHNPHTGEKKLLARSPQALCTSCHDPGGSSSGEKGRYVTHSGLDCSTCHAPHGGDRPLLLVADDVDLCGGCHSHEHQVRHPLGEETRDPRTGSPMSCLSCHGIHRAEGEMYLYEEDLRMLCVGCHKDLGPR